MTNSPPPRLVPDRPSAEFPTPSPAAVKKAKDEAATRQFPSEMHWASWVIDRAREIDAAAPPAEAPGDIPTEADALALELVSVTEERDFLRRQLAAAPAAPASMNCHDFVANNAQPTEFIGLYGVDDARDAGRYRWLRIQNWFDGPLCVLQDPKKVLTSGRYGLGADCPSRERLDAAIDAAMKDAP